MTETAAIVQRLGRTATEAYNRGWQAVGEELEEAAAEIERLQARVAELEKRNGELEDGLWGAQAVLNNRAQEISSIVGQLESAAHAAYKIVDPSDGSAVLDGASKS